MFQIKGTAHLKVQRGEESMTFSAISRKFIRDGWDEGKSQRVEAGDVAGGQHVFTR